MPACDPKLLVGSMRTLNGNVLPNLIFWMKLQSAVETGLFDAFLTMMRYWSKGWSAYVALYPGITVPAMLLQPPHHST